MTRSSPIRTAAQAAGALVGAFLVALVVVAGATKWLPQGAAGIDHIMLPIAAFPVVWGGSALTLYGARRPLRAWSIAGGVVLLHILLIVLDRSGGNA